MAVSSDVKAQASWRRCNDDHRPDELVAVSLLMLAVGALLGGSRASADAMYSISALGDPLANSADPPTICIHTVGRIRRPK